MISLLLASASPARAALLRAAGITPQIQPADVDEASILAGARDRARRRCADLTVADAVLLLARAKAEEIAATDHGADLVLGCDSLLEIDGEALGKPGTAAEARERWLQMRGRAGVLHTGHWVITADGPATGASAATTVHFAEVTEIEIEAYIATGEPLQVAGAFTLDGLGGAFVERIEGDHHTVVGLSLVLLRRLLGDLGIAWPDLWCTDRD